MRTTCWVCSRSMAGAGAVRAIACRSILTICSAWYFRVDISRFLLREILSHFNWYKKARPGHLF